MKKTGFQPLRAPQRLQRVLLFVISLTSAALLGDSSARADRGVGLGVAFGIAIPEGGNVDFKPAANWGFFTDIPLISTFHITPSTLVYTVKVDGAEKGQSATDVSLNFKFIVPLGVLDVFGGITAGLTSTQSLDPHVGLLGGAAINVVSNIDIFAQLNYRVIIVDDTNRRDLQIYAGPLFRFY